MKRFFALILTVIMLLSTFVACNDTGNEPAETTAETTAATTASTTADVAKPKSDKLYVGYGRANITPRDENGRLIPVYLAGYPDTRIATNIVSDLYASCVAIRDEAGDIALIYSIDVIGISDTFVVEIQNLIKRETGVPTQNILLNASHSHTAPYIDLVNHEEIVEYNKIFYNGILDSGKSAIADLSLCTELYAGTLDGTGLNFVRRYVTDAQGNMRHERESDAEMPVVRFVREGKKDVILANWAAHSDTVTTYNFYAISADYIGYFRDAVEAERDAYLSVCMAASGDVNAYSKIEGETVYKTTRAYGRALANLLTDNINTLQKLDIKSDVEVRKTTMKAYVDHSTDHLLDKAKEIHSLYHYADDKALYQAKCREYGIFDVNEASRIIARAAAVEFEGLNLSALSIGNIVFGAAPYEMLTQTGVDIKENSPFELTFVCGYTNGKKGYIPPEYSYENGGYEVTSCQYVKGTAEQIQAEISTLIDKLYANTYEKQ